MKKTLKFLPVLLLCIPLLMWQSSCTKTESCDGMGTLTLTNNSNGTVQKLMIDGVNYGTIDPDEKKDIKLGAGEHEFQFVGISGGSGCSAAKVIIVGCKSSGFQCNN